MEKKLQHGTALTVAGVMALIAAVMIAVGLVVDTQWNYALLFMGAFLLVIAVVVFATFTYQESVFRKVMREPLMELNVTGTDLDKMVQENSDAIRAQNLLSLIIMLFFFFIIIVVGLFLGPDGRMMSLMMLIIALMISLAAYIITKYRISKIKRSTGHVVISRRGALVHGQFHNWSIPGARIDKIELKPSAGTKSGTLVIEYSALTRTGRNTAILNIKYPYQYEPHVQYTVSQLQNYYSEK